MDRQECPQCNADLTCFQVLDALQEQEAVRPVQGRRVWLPVAMVTVFLIISVGLGWIFYQNFLIMQSLKDNRSSLEYVDRSVQGLIGKVENEKQRNGSEKQKEREMSAVNSDKEAPPQGLERMSNDAKIPKDAGSDRAAVNPPAEDKKAKLSTEGGVAVKTSTEGSAVKPKALKKLAKVKGHAVKPETAPFFWYETTDKDTVWGISERFYQSGRYYPVLLTMNPQISIYEIKAGQRLKILKNQKDAITAFNRSVTRKGFCVYLWYQVQGGDTPKTLSMKFYKTADQYSIINQINPNLHLEPGQRISVLLPDLS